MRLKKSDWSIIKAIVLNVFLWYLHFKLINGSDDIKINPKQHHQDVWDFLLRLKAARIRLTHLLPPPAPVRFAGYLLWGRGAEKVLKSPCLSAFANSSSNLFMISEFIRGTGSQRCNSEHLVQGNTGDLSFPFIWQTGHYLIFSVKGKISTVAMNSTGWDNLIL